MAIENKSKPTQPLNKPFSLIAGVVSAAAGIGGIAGSTIYLAQMSLAAELTAVIIADMVLLAVMFIAGVQLVLGKESAQRVLLVVFLAVAIVATTFCLSAMLTSVPAWWDDFTPVPFMMVMIPLAAGSVVLSVLLVLASNAGTRMRYASITGCSVAAAVALIIAANMIAQTEGRYKRYDIEQLNIHGLSERTKKILSDVKAPLKITCIYAPSDKKARELAESKYLPRLMSMLREMQEFNSRIEVIDASSDVDKAEVVTALAELLNSQAAEHSRFVDDFLTRSEAVIDELAKQQKKWGALKEGSYLSNWALPAHFEEQFGQLAESWRKTSDATKRKLASKAALVDYAGLVEEIKQMLDRTRTDVSDIREMLNDVAEVPVVFQASRAVVQKSLDEAVESVKAMAAVLESANSPTPADAAAILKKYVEASGKASAKIKAAGDAVNDVYAKNSNKYIIANRRMIISTEEGYMPLGEFLRQFGGAVDSAADDVRGYIEKATPEAQLELIGTQKKEAANLIDVFGKVCGVASDAIKQLGSVDEPTKQIFAEVKDDSLFKPVTGPTDELVAEAEKLPELKTTFTPDDISRDNIVVIESGDKVEIVSFDEVWPRRSMMGPDDENNRYFDGDEAVSSRILTMTQPLPFAVVFMASFEPEIPQEMAPYIAPPDISADNMSVVARCLEKANLKVVHWNLAADMPEVEEAYKNLPRVLLVLPPTQILTQFGPAPGMSFSKEHAEKIIAAIDSGVSAVVLTWCNPRLLSDNGGSKELCDYLRDSWGVEEKTDFMVFPAEPDETEAGKYLFNKKLFGYFPLSTFTDHPIGEPLQGVRMLWFALCPIVISDSVPAGVTAEDVLVVPRGQRGVWATRRLESLGKQINTIGSLIEPDYGKGDLAPPFAVAVAAVREGGDKNSRPTRMVVMGNAYALVDDYVTGNVDIGGSGMKLADPPRNNPNIVVNSVYWASGNEDRIAAGPTTVKPIAMLDEKTETMIRVFIVAGLPLLLLALGGLVLYVRRR